MKRKPAKLESIPRNQRLANDAENAAVGAMLAGTDKLDESFARCSQEHFANDILGFVWHCGEVMHRSGRPIMPESIAAHMVETFGIDTDGAVDILTRAMDSATNAHWLPEYAGSVFRHWQERMALESISRFDDVLGSTGAFEAILAELRTELDALTRAKTANEIENGSAESVLLRIGDQAGEVEVMPIGIPSLDAAINGGARRGQLIVVAARAGVGKSIMLGQWAVKSAQRGLAAMLLSYEMTSEEVFLRMIPAGGYRMDDPIDMERMSGLRLWAVEAAGWSLDRIESEARTAKRDGRLDVLLVDYLGLIAKPDQSESDITHIANITRRLKLLAQQLSVVVILAAQFNRSVEGREDKTPRLADLRGSGAIEQDADIVIGIHRESDPERQNEAVGHVMKHRKGPRGTVRLMFVPERASFCEQCMLVVL